MTEENQPKQENKNNTEKRYIIEYDRENCIGSAPCVAEAPDRWELSKEDGKAILINGKKEGEIYIHEITEEEFERNMNAAKNCPVNVIHIIDKKTGKRLI